MEIRFLELPSENAKGSCAKSGIRFVGWEGLGPEKPSTDGADRSGLRLVASVTHQDGMLCLGA